MATVSLSTSKPVSLKVDALVVGVAKIKGGGFVLLPGGEEVDKALKGRIAETVAAMGNLGNPNEVSKLSSLGATTAPIVVAVCVGKARRRGPRRGRRTGRGAAPGRRCRRPRPGRHREGRAGAAGRDAGGGGRRQPRARCSVPTPSARYRVTSTERNRPPVEAFTLVTDAPRDKANKAAVARAHTLVDAVHLARDWVNIPPVDLPPAELADRAAAAAKAAGVAVEVLDEKALKKAGYGGILGVGRARRARRGW